VTFDTARQHTPSTNEIVLPASGLTCDFAGFLYTCDTDCGISADVTADRTRTATV
jgi:hypothetical protein